MKVGSIDVELIDLCGSDLSVVNAARVSFAKESDWEKVRSGTGKEGDPFRIEEVLSEKDRRLITYLAEHDHTSPFNHCFASFRVKAPIFVARQLVKHKFLPWNEVSRRYVDDEPEFYFPEVWRKRAENVKQGSSDEAANIILNEAGWYEFHHPQCGAEACLALYRDMLESGVCPEQARMVLPQNTMTEWVWSGTLGAWADMCRLRLDPHAQLETRWVAEKIAQKMAQGFPASWAALLNKK